jgi:diguanylate cyclase (GGDEF)-like protein
MVLVPVNHAPPGAVPGDLILIADDDPLLLKILEQSLTQDGYRVAIATNGVECLRQFQQERPALVLVDAMMPEMNGFDCCQALLSQPGAANLPVLIITGLEDQVSIDQAFAAGATDYITKPIRWPVLRHRLRLLLEQLRQQALLESNHRDLQALVMTDTLTKLANRRRFDEELEKERRRALRDGRTLSLVRAELDSFQSYRDRQGRSQGDRALQQVAQTLILNVHRASDLIARYGGAEFAVLLPNTHGSGALFVAERIRQALWDANLAHDQDDLAQGDGQRPGECSEQLPGQSPTPQGRLTLSLGVASLGADPERSAATLVQWANGALDQAKDRGGNKTVCYKFPTAMAA